MCCAMSYWLFFCIGLVLTRELDVVHCCWVRIVRFKLAVGVIFTVIRKYGSWCPRLHFNDDFIHEN